MNIFPKRGVIVVEWIHQVLKIFIYLFIISLFNSNAEDHPDSR